MKSASIHALALLLVVVVFANAKRTCNVDLDCGAGKCCQKPSMMAKPAGRRVVTSGTCKPYLTEGQRCTFGSTSYGFCGCAPGLACEWMSLVQQQYRWKRAFSHGYDSLCTQTY